MPRAVDKRRAGRHRGANVTRELAIVVGVAVLLSFLLKQFLIQAFFIPSGSMEDTLMTGDRIVVNKLAVRMNDLQRGDVVVFEDPGNWLNNTDVIESRSPLTPVRKTLEFLGLAPVRNGDDLVKRVIGVAGDHVQCCTNGQVTVNGVALDESDYIFPGVKPSDVEFDVTVPPGTLWVMGDHRNDSLDSRFHQDEPSNHGFVPLAKVRGRAVAVVWPFGHKARLHRPGTFDQPELQPGKAT